MEINIKRVVARLENIAVITPIIEAVKNSIEANASNISVKCYFKDTADLAGKNIIEKIEIIDNGEGFTEVNIKSFSTYQTDKKAKIGCKGIGRMTYLKIFNKVTIESYDNIINKSIKADFNFKFDQDSFKKQAFKEQDNASKDKFTKIIFQDSIEQQTLDIQYLRKELLTRLLPKLALSFHNNNYNALQIHIEDINSKTELTISEDAVPKLEKHSFSIKEEQTLDNKSYNFELLYNIRDPQDSQSKENSQSKNLYAYYCVDNVIVTQFKTHGITINCPDNKEIFFYLLSPDYFVESRINDTRDKFLIEKNPNKTRPLGWSQINEKLKNILHDILCEHITDLKEKHKTDKEKVINKFPHLTQEINALPILGSSDQATIKNQATTIFRKKQDNLDKLIESAKIDYKDDTHKKEIELTIQKELAWYINHRQIIIENLEQEIKKSSSESKNEKIIHNLFCPQYKDSKADSNKNSDKDSADIIPLK